MKKCFTILAFAALVAGPISAQSNWSFGGGLALDIFGEITTVDIAVPGVGNFRTQAAPVFAGFGIFRFVDIGFSELSVTLMGGPSDAELNISWMGITEIERASGSFVALDFGIKLKPLLFLPHTGRGYGWSWFPYMGIGYTAMLISVIDGEVDPRRSSHLNAFRLGFGMGFDFNISESMFIRTSMYMGLRLRSRNSRDIANEAVSVFQEHNPYLEGNLTHSGLGVNIPTLRVGLGFRR